MKIICVGCNYPEHIKETGGQDVCGTDKLSDAAAGNVSATGLVSDSGCSGYGAGPIFFLKPDTALLRNNDPFYLPSFSEQIDYEGEFVVRINKVGKAISERYARRYYDEVAVGVDFTARDLQREAIAKGLPWEMAKGFDRSAAIPTDFLRLDDLGGDAGNLNFELSLNGEVRQSANTSEMLHSVDRIISYVSRFMMLRIGDLIFTGTPAGVGQVKSGDNIKMSLEGHTLLDFEIK